MVVVGTLMQGMREQLYICIISITIVKQTLSTYMSECAQYMMTPTPHLVQDLVCHSRGSSTDSFYRGPTPNQVTAVSNQQGPCGYRPVASQGASTGLASFEKKVAKELWIPRSDAKLLFHFPLMGF